MFPATFTPEELTAWLNTLDVATSFAIMEKLYKDMRDYTFALHEVYESREKEAQ